MKTTAFACVAVVVVAAVAVAQQQPGDEERASGARVPDPAASPQVLRKQYLELHELKARRMTEEELRREVQQLQQLRAEEQFDQIVDELKGVAERHPQTLASRKAKLAIQLLRTRDERAIDQVGRVLIWGRSQEQTPAKEGYPFYYYYGYDVPSLPGTRNAPDEGHSNGSGKAGSPESGGLPRR